MSDFATSYFWEAVSGSHESTAHTAALIHGKVSVAAWWPFLSAASTEADFENRLQIVSERIEAAVEPDVYEAVVSSLYDDFRAVTAASEKASLSCGHADCVDGLPCKKEDPETWEKAKGRKESAQKGPDNYSAGTSPCCDADGHRPGKSGDFFCKDCGSTFSDKSIADSSKKESSIKIAAEGETDEGGHPTHIPLAQWHESNPNARDYSYHKYFQCPEHPKAKFSSKNPYDRSMFPSGDDFEDCDHPISSFHYVGSEKVKAVQRSTPKEATNYQPDINADWRYYYPDLNGPVDNGALQDSDGFVKDLAEGEGRSTPKIEQEITPGVWTSHDGMPERPMPAGVARGYMPVNASLYDNDGFLVEAYSGRGVDPLVDPAPGTPQQSNPFYFNPDGAMGANEGFPVDPSAEPLEDRANTYGDVAPQMSSESTEGTIDGNGYSRSHPGESPDFNRGAGERKTASHADYLEGHSDGSWHAKIKRQQDPQRDHPDYHEGYADGWNGEATPSMRRQQEPNIIIASNASLHTANKYIKQQDGKWVITQKGTGKVLSRHDSEEEAEASFRAMMQSKHGAFSDHTNESEYLEGHEHGLAGHGLFDHHRSPSDSYEQGHQNGSALREELDPEERREAEQRSPRPHFSPDQQKSVDDWSRAPWARESGHGGGSFRDMIPSINDFRSPKSNLVTAIGDDYDPDTRHHINRGASYPLLGHEGNWAILKHPSGDHVYTDRSNVAPLGKSHRHAAQASTDGKIVDHCPGCDEPRRIHSTMHGVEIRHLHNDHVRCHGDRTASVLPNGANFGNHDRPVTFQEGLAYNGEYGTHFTPEDITSLASLVTSQLSNGSVHTAGDYLGRPDATNPTGRGSDEYEANTWDAYRNTHPMQSAEDRGVNTPQAGAEPIRTRNIGTPQPGLREPGKGERGDDEAENGED